MINNSNNYFAQSNCESINSKNNEVSHLHFDQFRVQRLVASRDSVNQSSSSASRNPTIRITGLIVGCSITRQFHRLPCHDPIPSSTGIHGATVALIQSRMHPSRFEINRIKSMSCASNLGLIFFADVTNQNIQPIRIFCCCWPE